MELRSRAARILALPLLVMLVGLWVTRLRPTAAPREPGRPPEPPAAAPSQAAAEAPVSAPPLAPPTRDPFQGPVRQAPSPSVEPRAHTQGSGEAPALRLQGIIWGVQPPRAIVNDHVLTVGDTAHGIQILAIEPEGVTVAYQGHRVMLRVNRRLDARQREGEGL